MTSVMAGELTTLRRASNPLMQAYLGTFARKPRVTCDASALRAIVAQAAEIVERSEIDETARTNLALYEGELRAVELAQRLGAAYHDFARLAALSNALLAVYERVLGGKPRGSVDPVFLEDLDQSVRRLEESMRALARPGSPESFARDVEVLARARSLFAAEAIAIERAQQTGTPADQFDGLQRLLQAQRASFSRYGSRPPALARPAVVRRYVSVR
jgi:hypothetical protein